MALGNVGTSSLLRSANSVASQINDYKDKMSALEWNSSAQTDADWAKYKGYLSGRIGKLSQTGVLSDASKALTLTGNLQSANRSYTSNVIQRSSIAILEGNGSPVDKQSSIINSYQQAVANGDQNLAQNLRQQYDSLNQQIQYDAEVAQKSSSELYKANQTAQAEGYTDAVGHIKDMLRLFNSGFEQTGQGFVSKDLGKFSESIRQYAKTVGVDIPKGSNINNGSVVQGAINTIYALEGKAADVYKTIPGGSSKFNQAVSEQSNIVNGLTTFDVGGANLNLEDANFYAQHPDALHQVTKGTDLEGRPIYGLEKSAVLGYQFDKNGVPQPIYSTKDQGPSDQTAYQKLDKNGQDQMKKDLQDAGFTIKENNGNVQATTSSNGANGFFNNAIKGFGVDKSTTFNVIKTSSGYQLSPIIDANGTTQLLTIAKDDTGKFGVYNNQFNKATGTVSNNLIGQFNGFNSLANSQTGAAGQYAVKQSGTNFNFFDPNGKPISAAEYSKHSGIGFRDLLQRMSNAGDVNSKTALQYVGNDYKFGAAPTSAAGSLSALGASGNYTQPKPVKPGTMGNPMQPFTNAFVKQPNQLKGKANFVQNGASFNFYDASGKAINAAQYSMQSGTGYRDLLSKMSASGDQNAKIALNYVGNDYKFGSAPVKFKSNLSVLGASGNYK